MRRWQGRRTRRTPTRLCGSGAILFRKGDELTSRFADPARAIRPAVRGDAGRRGGQYRDAVADADDRPRARSPRHLGRGGVQPVGGDLGADRAALGAAGRPSRPPRADAARPLRLHRLDAGLRTGPGDRPVGLDRADDGVHRSSCSAAQSTAPGARPRRPRSRPMSPPAPRATSAPTRSPRSPPPSASERSSGPRSRRLFIFPPLGLSGPLIVFAGDRRVGACGGRAADSRRHAALLAARPDRRLSRRSAESNGAAPSESAERRAPARCAGAIRGCSPGTSSESSAATARPRCSA